MKNDQQRPPIWIGHVFLDTNNIEHSQQFMRLIGMRSIASGDDFAVLELRGGTHVIVREVEEAQLPGEVGWDIMVDDIDATHSEYAGKGYSVSEVRRGNIPDNFDLTLPDGRPIEINSSHAGDRAA